MNRHDHLCKPTGSIIWLVKFIGCVIISTQANAAAIRVDFQGNDIVGQRLGYEIREAISASSQHKLVLTDEDAGFVLHIVTVEYTKDISTSYAAVLTLPDPEDKTTSQYYINVIAGNCGRDNVAQCGKGIVSSFDTEINAISTSILEALRKPKK